MALLKVVSQEEATGEMKEMYDAMIEKIGLVPKPFELASVSPHFQKMLWQNIGYYSQHPNIEFTVFAFIRLLSADRCNHEYCKRFNAHALKKMGMTEEELNQIYDDPSKAPLEEKDLKLVLFALKAVDTPEKTEQADIDALHDLGWTDMDIYDAVFHGANMVGSRIVTEAFKISTNIE